MKRVALLSLTLLISINFVAACDVCGGGGGGSYMGILPQFQKNIIGIRHQTRTFKTKGTDVSSTFFTEEFWLRMYPIKKLQFFAFVPYKINTSNEIGYKNVSGIGDMAFLANYAIVNTGDSITKRWKNTLLFGGGVKLPTGKYQQRNAEKLLYPTYYQIGNGSNAYLLNLIYTTRYDKWGLNADVQHRINSENEIGYRQGTQTSFSFMFFYWKRLKDITLLPNVGIQIESQNMDRNFGNIVEQSSGKVSSLGAGCDIYIGKWATSISAFLPYNQRLQISQQSTLYRMNASVSYLF